MGGRSERHNDERDGRYQRRRRRRAGHYCQVQGRREKIIVTPNVPIVRYEVADMNAIEPGSAFTVIAAVPKTDGSFDVSRINVGRNGASPP